MFCPQAVLLAGFFFVEKHNGNFVVLCVINCFYMAVLRFNL